MENQINGYIQTPEGKWVLSQEAKAEALATYYSGRLAYDSQDLRHAIGRYTSSGEIAYFKPWSMTSIMIGQ